MITTLLRPLPNIVCDLQEVREKLGKHYARPFDPTEAEDREWDALEDRLCVLQREFVEAFRDVTGVSWSVCEGVMG